MRSDTIKIEKVAGYNALKMIWPERPTAATVAAAFSQIVEELHILDEKCHIIVDLQSDPLIPITDTFHHVVTGPFSHEYMGEWLVIGSSKD